MAARSITSILSKAPNPRAIPFHRIVYANGTVWLAPEFEKKRRMLYKKEGIVLGKNGQTIKAIGQAARTEIAELIGQPVHLFLFVMVRSTWASDPERLRTMGLELPRR